jgi:hypothetical protein
MHLFLELLETILDHAGDATDNIPGIRGIGLKRAGELVQRYHSLENMFVHLPHLVRLSAGICHLQHTCSRLYFMAKQYLSCSASTCTSSAVRVK